MKHPLLILAVGLLVLPAAAFAGGVWTPAVNMGPRFSTADSRASSVALSPEGRFFFFSSSRRVADASVPGGRLTRQRLLEMHERPEQGSSDLWWVAARVLGELRPE